MATKSNPNPHTSPQTLPSRWVTRFAAPAKPTETALDLACGGGRNGRWLRDRGVLVTFLDRDLDGVDDLSGESDAELIAADLETGAPFPLAGRRFDWVVVTNYLWRPLLRELCDCVTPGGMLIYETFGDGNAEYGRPRNPDFLLLPGELAGTVRDGFDIVGYEHGLRREPTPAVVQRLAAVKR